MVTGASQRVGREICLALAEKGASVVVHYHSNEKEAERTASAVRQIGSEAIALQADLRHKADIEHLVATTIAHFGRWDALINNASLFSTVPIQDIDEKQWDADQDLHVKAPFFLSQALYMHRKERDYNYAASIVNITDTLVYRRPISRPSYNLAKSALAEQVKVLAKSLGPLVRVNAVAPGAIMANSAADTAYFERLAATLPLKKLATVADVVSSVLFLLTTDSITAEQLVVDCGEQLL